MQQRAAEEALRKAQMEAERIKAEAIQRAKQEAEILAERQRQQELAHERYEAKIEAERRLAVEAAAENARKEAMLRAQKEEMERRLAEEKALRQQQEQKELEAAAQAAAQLREQEAAAQAAAQLRAQQELQAQQQAQAQQLQEQKLKAQQQADAQREAEIAAQQQLQKQQSQNNLNSSMRNLSVNTQQAPQPTNGPMQQLNVTLPNNIKPGETFQIRTPQGALATVTCPVGKYGGQTITVNVPGPPPATSPVAAPRPQGPRPGVPRPTQAGPRPGPPRPAQAGGTTPVRLTFQRPQLGIEFKDGIVVRTYPGSETSGVRLGDMIWKIGGIDVHANISPDLALLSMDARITRVVTVYCKARPLPIDVIRPNTPPASVYPPRGQQYPPRGQQYPPRPQPQQYPPRPQPQPQQYPPNAGPNAGQQYPPRPQQFAPRPRGIPRPGDINGDGIPDHLQPHLFQSRPRPRAPGRQRYVVTIPPGVGPGMRFRINTAKGPKVIVCPAGKRPGDRVTYQF